MIYSVHQPSYLPWLGFFDKIDKSDCFIFLDEVQYKHREYQNRNKIRTKDGWIWLTVPVRVKQGAGVRDVEIDNSRNWSSSHLKSLKSWYGTAEFFDCYFPFFEKTFSGTWGKLIDLNITVTQYLLKALSIDKPIYFESALGAGGTKTERIINIGKKLGADRYLSGAGGKDYLEEPRFSDNGIELVYQEFSHPVYKQRFTKRESDFVPNLSVVDLLFNEGDRSLDVLRGGKGDLRS